MIQHWASLAKNDEVKYWIEHNLVNAIKSKALVTNSEVEHIIDYLNSDSAPSKLRKMSYQEALHNAEKWSNALIKKGLLLSDKDEDIKLIAELEDGFRIVELVTQAAYTREGSLMKHCVSSYYDKKEITIYSLRDMENMPHCTFEVQRLNNNQINQIKGKGNGSIHPKYVKYIVGFLNSIGVDVRSSEMRNLGYEAVKDYEVSELNKILVSPEKLFTTINNETYLFCEALKTAKLKPEFKVE
jgi:hypothetical protein